MNRLIRLLPKAELHIHIEGALTAELALRFAERNQIAIPYKNLKKLQAAYDSCDSLQTFLAVYYHVSRVMRTEQDFYDLMYAYLTKAARESVLHAEIFFEVQSFLHQEGMSFAMIVNGLYNAHLDAQKALGISSELILCFLRDRPQDEALAILEQSLQFKEKIIGIGLASQEKGNPPSKFEQLFKQAKAYGYKLCAHAGEDAGPEYIWQAIELLHVDRIAHGVRCMEDPQLVAYLVKKQLPLTVCPLSNIKLGIFPNIAQHPIKKMLEVGLLVSINSDDPTFFGGYIDKNYEAVHKELGMSKEQLIACARNSFLSSWVSDQQKEEYLKQLQAFKDKHAQK